MTNDNKYKKTILMMIMIAPLLAIAITAGTPYAYAGGSGGPGATCEETCNFALDSDLEDCEDDFFLDTDECEVELDEDLFDCQDDLNFDRQDCDDDLINDEGFCFGNFNDANSSCENDFFFAEGICFQDASIVFDQCLIETEEFCNNNNDVDTAQILNGDERCEDPVQFCSIVENEFLLQCVGNADQERFFCFADADFDLDECLADADEDHFFCEFDADDDFFNCEDDAFDDDFICREDADDDFFNCEDDAFETFDMCIDECFVDIHGMKFWDLNIDGVKDAEEPRLDGWQFTLDCNNDYGDFEVSHDGGNYWFTDIPIDNLSQCTITETVQNGWFVTTSNPRVLSIDSSETIEDVDFGNALVMTASKSWTETDYTWDGNTETDDVLADELPTDEDGKFLVNGNTHRKTDVFLNTQPGAFFAVTTVEVNVPIDQLMVDENYWDCTGTENDGILKLLAPQAKLERAVKVAIADSNDDVTELTGDLYNGEGGSITANTHSAEVIIDGPIEAGSTVYVLVKFQHNLKGVEFDDGEVDVMCNNQEWVKASIDGVEFDVHVDADLRITNQLE